MTNEQLKEGLYINSQICKIIEKMNLLDPAHPLKIVIKLQDKSGQIVHAIYPEEKEKDVFETIRIYYLDYLQTELNNLKEKFKNL